MPALVRSVAICDPPKKASLTDLEQLVIDFRKDKNYKGAAQILDTVDGLKPQRRVSLDEHVTEYKNERENIEAAAMEKHESIEPTADQNNLEYIRIYGMEQFIYSKSAYDIRFLRDRRYLNAQLAFLEDHDIHT